ncbi:MAG: M48 family metallopeptidase, partial [Marmoricola sp.]
MKHTLRALLALGLLAGCYLLSLLVVAGLALVGYAFLRMGLVGGVLVLPFLLGLFVLYAVGTALLASTRAGREVPTGMLLTPDAQPELWSRVRALADEVGTRPPDEIRLVPDVNASVTEGAKLLGLASGVRRMTIGVPLLLGLTRGQLVAVLAHELGHYGGRHTTLATATYRGGEALRRVLHEVGEESAAGRLFAGYARLYFRVSREVSRRQELEADETATRIAGRDVTIAALRELAPLATAWELFGSGYLGPAQRLGLRPVSVAEGFLDLLENPERRSWLDTVREHPGERPATSFDSHPTTSRRVAILNTLSDVARERDEVPGYAVLADPDATMTAFFATWYGEDSGLEPADWQRIGSALSQHHVESAAADLARAMRRAPWRKEREVTFDALAAELRSGRGPQLADLASRTGSTAEKRALAGVLVGSLVGATLVQHGRASYQLDWAGSGRLVDRSGARFDLAVLADRALGSDAGVAELT